VIGKVRAPLSAIIFAVPPTVLPFPEARRIVEQHAAKLLPARQPELLDIREAGGRVLAEPIVADRDLPPFPRATRDGYAVRSNDLQTLPAHLEVIGEIKAGDSSEASSRQIESGQAVAIMTGAPAPPGADAVVMVEYTTRDRDIVNVQRGVAAGENIVPRGAEGRAGEVLLQAGTMLSPAAIALAASVGKSQLHVYVPPKVAVLSTGDEIVDIATRPGPHQIRNSNTFSLAAQIRAAGGIPTLLPIAPDKPGELKRLIEDGLRSDLLLIAGGVSMGKYDLVEQVLAEFEAEFFFTGALIQPGRPVVFGRAKSTRGASPREIYFLGLPGNPVSTLVTFDLFARPLINALSGAGPGKLWLVQVRLKSDIKTKTGLTRFLPATLSGKFDQTEVELVRWQGSGDIAAAARANCYLVVPPDRERISAGEMVSVLLG